MSSCGIPSHTDCPVVLPERGIRLHIQDNVLGCGGCAIWISDGTDDLILIGHKATRDETLREAVEVLEATVELLQQPKGGL